MGQPVARDDEEYYMKLLEEGRRTEQQLYGNNVEEWEEQKYISRLRRQERNSNKSNKIMPRKSEKTNRKIYKTLVHN